MNPFFTSILNMQEYLGLVTKCMALQNQYVFPTLVCPNNLLIKRMASWPPRSINPNHHFIFLAIVV